MAVDVFKIDWSKATMRRVHRFFATAAVTAITQVKDNHIALGDRLGNVYLLQLHSGSSESASLDAGEGTPYDNRSAHDDPSESGLDNDSFSSLGSDVFARATTDDFAAKRDAAAHIDFNIINQQAPRGLTPAEKKAWLHRRQAVLMAAMKAQKHSPEARIAVRIYSQSTMELYNSYNRTVAAHR